MSARLAWRPRTEQRVRSVVCGVEATVVLVRGDVALVRLEGAALRAVLTHLIDAVSHKRAAGQKVLVGWHLIASLGEAEDEEKPVEMIWLLDDLAPLRAEMI